MLPKSPSGTAVRYTLNQWEALRLFLQDGDLEIGNGATERANRHIALGRGNWTFWQDRCADPFLGLSCVASKSLGCSAGVMT